MTLTRSSRSSRVLCVVALVLGLLLSLLPTGQLAAQETEVDPSLARLDLDGDGRISEIDIQYVATAWESRRISGNVCSGPSQADVNGDGCLDIADVQTVAGKVGVAVTSPSAMAETQSALVAADPTFVVTTTSDASDSNPGDGLCEIAGGGCSLRGAIDEANRMPGANTINFNIPGSGPHVINVTAVDSDDRAFTLSDTTGPTIINGYSQPGSSPNTSPTVSNAVIKIHIKGPRVANTSIRNYQSIDGFRVFSAGNEFRGLAFTNLRRSIWLSGSGARDNIVAGCFIGTDPAGQPWYEAINSIEGRGGDDGAFGMWLSDGASYNRIGGAVPADRTVISGNAQDGGGGVGAGTEYNRFIGLLVGLSPDGSRRLRNFGDGLDLNFGMSYTQIGGLAPGERNVISGNAGEGVEVSHDPSTAYNTIAGNYFGTAPDGNTIVNNLHYNAGYSVSLEDSVSNNTIGPGNVMVNSFKGGVHIYGALGSGNQITGNRIGVTLNGAANTLSANRGEGIRIRFGASDVTVGPDNIITNSTRAGVLVIDNTSRFNTITQNSIYGNGAIGIDLGGTKDTGGDGVTPNDGAWGSGPNQRIDFPVITTATTTTVSGTALTGYRVEVFLADSPAGQYGEGKTFAGAGVADGSGQFTIPVSGVPAGGVVTATATDSAGNTSEFSLNVAATGGTANTPPAIGIDAPANGATISGSATVSVNASDAEDAAGTLNVQVRIDGGAWQAAAWNAASSRYQLIWSTTAVANGSHTIEARVTDSSAAVSTAGPINVSVTNAAVPTYTLPALIQAEDYNQGGEGIGYHDTTAGNTGGRYRTDDVDIQTCTDPTTPSGQTCFNVGWTAGGEWLAYGVRIPAAGDYTFALRVATPSNNRTIQLQLDGANLGAPVAVPNTGGYQAWTTVSVVRQLPAGDHGLRLVISSTNLNLNSIDITATTNTSPTVAIATPASGATVSGATTIGVTANDAQDAAGTLNVQVRIDGGAWQAAGWNSAASRYQLTWSTTAVANGGHTIEARVTDSGGATATSTPVTVTVNNVSVPTAVPLPATIQAEDYVDYRDSDATNVGGAYRKDAVDIGTCSDGTGCLYVGWTVAGEWLSYSVSNTSSAPYTVLLRYASPYAGRRVKVEVDGTILSTVSLPASGGWDTWRTATVGTASLSPGQHTIRLLIDLDGLNINWLSVTQS